MTKVFKAARKLTLTFAFFAAWNPSGVYADNAPAVMQPGVEGEVVPVLTEKNLVANGDFLKGLEGWKVECGPGVLAKTEIIQDGERSFLRIKKAGQPGALWLVSGPFAVNSKTICQYTGLVRTQAADFSSTGLFALQTAATENGLGKLPIPPSTGNRSAQMGLMRLRMERNDGWPRKTSTINIPDTHQVARMVFILEGPGEEVDVTNLIVNLPEPDSRAGRALQKEVPLSHEETIARLKARPDSTARVERRKDGPSLLIDDKPSVPFIHMTDVSKPQNGYLRDFAQHGISIHIVQLFNKTTKHWTGQGSYDFKAIDEILWNAVGCDPDGGLIVGLNVLSYPEWRKDFPESTAQMPGGKIATSRHQDVGPASYWSVEYRKQVLALVKAYVEHIHSQPYGRAVVGYFITGGEDGQFYYQVAKGNSSVMDGQSPDDLPTFRDWMKRHYAGDQVALQNAWHRPDLTFENVFPSIENKVYGGTFLRPDKDVPVHDFMLFLNESLAEFLCDVADQIKRTSPKPVVVGAYYGRGGSFMVYPQFGDAKIMFPRRSLDFMGAQGHYDGYREAGLAGINPWVFNSMEQAGVIPMLELDYRTWLGQYKNIDHDFHVARYWNLADFSGATAREAGRMLSIKGGLWWMEMTGGWFRDDGIMDYLGQLRRAAQEIYTDAPALSPADTVLVADASAFLWTTEQVNLWNGPQMHSLNVQQRAFQTAGISFDFMYLEDLLSKGGGDYKVYYFLNPYLADKRLQELSEKLLKQGKTVVWQYAPGWLTDAGESTQSMKSLTGFDFRADGIVESSLRAAFVSPKDLGGNSTGVILATGLDGHPVGSGVGVPADRFVVVGGYDGVLSRFEDGGEPCAAWRRESDGGGLAITLGHPSALTPQLIANIADASHAQRYIDPGDYFFYERSDLMIVHALHSGIKTVRLPGLANVREMLNGRISGSNVREISFPLDAGDTVWLRLESATQSTQNKP